MQQSNNRLQAFRQQLSHLSEEAQKTQFTQFIHQVVKMFGTCGIVVEQLSAQQCTTSMNNAPKVHNQIGSIQSAGILLTAESAMGLVIGMNLPDDKVLLVKSICTEFVKKTQGNIQASANLTEEQIAQLQNSEKGRIAFEIAVTDETNATTAICKATWAWFPEQVVYQAEK